MQTDKKMTCTLYELFSYLCGISSNFSKDLSIYSLELNINNKTFHWTKAMFLGAVLQKLLKITSLKLHTCALILE